MRIRTLERKRADPTVQGPVMRGNDGSNLLSWKCHGLCQTASRVVRYVVKMWVDASQMDDGSYEAAPNTEHGVYKADCTCSGLGVAHARLHGRKNKRREPRIVCVFHEHCVGSAHFYWIAKWRAGSVHLETVDRTWIRFSRP